MKTKTPAAAPTRTRRKHEASVPGLQFRAATEDEQKAGLCGVVQGIALPYGERDYYGTVFAPGCLDKTRTKVGSKKVKFYSDHAYAVHAHVGVLLALEDVGNAAVMTAGIFDTAAGRAAKEYIEAVLNSGAETGLSVGFYERVGGWQGEGEDRAWVFTEIELDEVSLTPRPAVPGAVVTGVRAEEGAEDIDPATAERAFRALAYTLPPERARAIVDEVLRSREAAATDTDTPSTTPPDKGATGAGDAPPVETPDDKTPGADVPATAEERRRAIAHALA